MKIKTEKTETKRIRKRDSLPIIFAIALLVCLAVGGWRAKANADAPYTIVFDLNSHGPTTPIDNDTVAENGTVTQPEAPVDDDWEFGGWYLDSECTPEKVWDFTTTLNNDSSVFEGDPDPTGFTLYAKWTPKAPVAASITGQSSQLSIQYGDESGQSLSVTVNTDIPEIAGHTIEYKWYKFTGEGTPVNGSMEGWTALNDDPDDVFEVTVPTSELGTTYYFCTVYSHRTALSASDYENEMNYYAMTTSGIMTVEITKREIVVSGIAAEEKEYDDTRTATLDYSLVELEGLIPGDDLSVEAVGTFEDADAGEDKVVYISGLTLTGNDVDKYVLASSGQQTETTANINSVQIYDVTAEISGNGEYPYTGEPIFPSIVVKYNDRILVNDKDYKIETSDGQNCIDVGDYSAIVKSIGNYKFDDISDLNYKIVKATLAINHIKLDKKLIYNGEYQKPTIVITYGENITSHETFGNIYSLYRKRC